MLSLGAFRNLGREQRYIHRNPAMRTFVSLFGPLGIHSRIRAGHILREIQLFAVPPDAQILDAGCGRALVLFAMAQTYPHVHLHGIEIDPDIVQANGEIVRMTGLEKVLTFSRTDLVVADIGKARYDMLISVDVLEHILDDVAVLLAFRAALKPGGVLLLHLPLRHQQQRRILPAFKRHLIADHVRDEYLPEELTEKLERAGFEILRMRYGFGWQGELAFELNSLFWNYPLLRAFFALLTYPLAWFLAYLDVNAEIVRGNSIICVARA